MTGPTSGMFHRSPPPLSPTRNSTTSVEADLCIRISTASAALAGVCLAVIGPIRAVIATRKISTFGDDLATGDAMLFMVSCVLAYWSVRARNARRMHRVEPPVGLRQSQCCGNSAPYRTKSAQPTDAAMCAGPISTDITVRAISSTAIKRLGGSSDAALRTLPNPDTTRMLSSIAASLAIHKSQVPQ